MSEFHNYRYYKQNRQDLRNAATPAEKILWKALQGRKLGGRKFRRQHSIGPYIVDFYCPDEKLVVELDGAHHYTVIGEQADFERDTYLANLKIRTLRFENYLVVQGLESVLHAIQTEFGKY